jgi:protein-tyrosine phosphatase
VTQIAGDEQRRLSDLTLAEGRRIAVPGLFNFRDLGGYPTADGEFPWHRLFRSDALHQLDPAGLAELSRLGLRTVVDLRTHVEVEIAPSPLDHLPARHVHVSILGGDLQSLPLELEAIYAYVVRECGNAIADAIRPLCSGEAFPALLHCSAGKDRTGIVVAMVLAVLGVPDECIAADYALSAALLDPQRTRADPRLAAGLPGQTGGTGGRPPANTAIGQLQVNTGLGDKLTEELIRSPPALILQVLAAARAAHGSVEDYLLAHGLQQSDLAGLRAALAG